MRPSVCFWSGPNSPSTLTPWQRQWCFSGLTFVVLLQLQVEMLAAIAENPKVVEKAKVRLSLLFDPLLPLLGQPQAVLTAAGTPISLRRSMSPRMPRPLKMTTSCRPLTRPMSLMKLQIKRLKVKTTINQKNFNQMMMQSPTSPNLPKSSPWRRRSWAVWHLGVSSQDVQRQKVLASQKVVPLKLPRRTPIAAFVEHKGTGIRTQSVLPMLELRSWRTKTSRVPPAPSPTKLLSYTMNMEPPRFQHPQQLLTGTCSQLEWFSTIQAPTLMLTFIPCTRSRSMAPRASQGILCWILGVRGHVVEKHGFQHIHNSYVNMTWSPKWSPTPTPSSSARARLHTLRSRCTPLQRLVEQPFYWQARSCQKAFRFWLRIPCWQVWVQFST